MTRIRAAKIAGIANDIPPVDLDDDDGAELLVLGVGRHVGRDRRAAVRRVRAAGKQGRARAPART